LVKKNIFSVVLCLLTLSLIITGCGKPSGNAEDVVRTYYQSGLDGNYAKSYDVLAQVNQNQLTKEEFMEWKRTDLRVRQLKEYKVNQVKEISDFKFGEITYSHAVEFNISEIFIDFSDDKKEIPITGTGYVVNENGQWKYLQNKNLRQGFGYTYQKLGWMTLFAKGIDKNLNDAIINLKKAAQIYEENAYAYYFLAIAYKDVGRLEDAETAALKGLEKAGDSKNLKSNLENALGNICLTRRAYAEARIHYQQALVLNPDNEYARNNMRLLR